eukprot:g6972.t1
MDRKTKVTGLDEEEDDSIIRLKCKVDGKCVITKKSVLKRSEFLYAALSDDEQATELSIDHINSFILAKVVEYLTYHQNVPVPTFPIPLPSSDMHVFVGPWDAAFCDADVDVIFRLLLAANYLAIKPLVDLLCAKLATLVRDRSVQQMKETFRIRPFTKEEEVQVRRDFPSLLDSPPERTRDSQFEEQ